MLKRFFVVIISLIVLFSGCAQSGRNGQSGDGAQSHNDIDIDWVNFVKLDGIQYIRTDYLIDPDKLGSKISEVKFKLSDNVKNPNYVVQDGDAAYLEKGTPIYNINGYKSSFRIAIKSTNEIIVYQAFDNPDAKIGSDIVDIFNKVNYIEINNDDQVIAVINDFKEINDMVDMILKAQLDLSTSSQIEKQYLMSFHLKDESEFKGAYWLESGHFSHVYIRFILPVEFKMAVEEALKNNSEV